MSNTIVINVKGLEEVQHAFQVAPQLAEPILGQAMMRSMALIGGAVAASQFIATSRTRW